MLSKQEEEQERRETLENDRLVREAEQRRIQIEGTTMHQFGQSQADEINQGRFAATGVPHVIGARADVASVYPAASAAHQTVLPPEPPTGYDVNEMPPIETSALHDCVEVTGGAPSYEPLRDVVAPPSFSPVGGPAPAHRIGQPEPARMTREAGPPSNKDADNGRA